MVKKREFRLDKPSGVSHLVDQFILTLAIILVSSWTQMAGLYAPFLVVCFCTDRITMVWKNTTAQTTMWTLIITYALTGTHVLAAPTFALITMWDQERLRIGHGIIGSIVTIVSSTVGNWVVPLTNPMTGTNNSLYFEPLKEFVDERIQEIKEILDTGLVTEAQFIRPNSISDYPIDLGNKPPLTADQTLIKYNEISRQTRMAIFGVMCFLVYLVGGIVGILVALTMVVISQMEKDESGAKYNEKHSGIQFKDGVYRVSTRIMGGELDRGIGTAYGGVMHIPYHVTKGRAIMYGRVKAYPYYTNIDEDIVTYGGPPKIDKLKPDDDVYVNCETDDSCTSYHADVHYDVKSNLIGWQGVTKPGESGSPVWAMRDGNLVLLGLAGRYVKTSDGVTEFTNVSHHEEVDSLYKTITMHPGSGKTWREIPNLVGMNLGAINGKKILVTGPTRVVCQELYGSLSRITNCSLNTKGSRVRSEMAQVQIAAHRTALKLLTTRQRCVRNLGMIIIDEAHVDDTATRLLRRFAMSAMGRGVRVVELSATLNGVVNDSSNHDITDFSVKEGDADNAIQEALQEGKRVMAFVPSLTGMVATRLKAKFKDHKPVLLSRSTFEAGMAGVMDEERKLVISTDIAECGINVPGLDVVVDYGRKYTYVNKGGIIVGEEIGLSEASKTQRRGRVGRSKPGSYYLVENRLSTKEETASEVDARILSVGRNWADDDIEWPFYLTDHQFEVWLDSDYTPMEIWMNYDTQGTPRSREGRQAKWKEIQQGDSYYIGCRDNCGRCEGKYLVMDERAHDRIFKLDKT